MAKKEKQREEAMTKNTEQKCQTCGVIEDAFINAVKIGRHGGETTVELCGHLLGYATALREKDMGAAAAILTALASAIYHGQTEEMVKSLAVGAKELGLHGHEEFPFPE